jgi:hypothetical protein
MLKLLIYEYSLSLIPVSFETCRTNTEVENHKFLLEFAFEQQ